MKLAPLLFLMIAMSATAGTLTDTDGQPATGDWLLKAAQVVPHPRQLAWQQLEFGGMIHFGMNTFTDQPWGSGKEDPRWFNPTNLDAREWVRTFKVAGMKLVVLTAKHHDGFCLWPSQYTEHSVKSSPWRNGQGDLVREVADACREEGLKFGVYLSPADLHEPSYGTPAYIRHFSDQLRELLTHYGEITEVWFDDANPSNKPAHYDFLAWRNLVRELQPGAVIFGRGPDVRWVGNEGGVPRASEWSVMPLAGLPEMFTGGNFMDPDLGSRDRIRGVKQFLWWPAEAAVSIRPEWFYHPAEDKRVRSADYLFTQYLRLVGGNTFYMLNVPPDRSGRLHPTDARNLRTLGEKIRTTFATDLAKGALVTASSTRMGNPAIGAQSLTDDDPDNYWAAAEGVSQTEITLTFPQPRTVTLLDLAEPIRFGQHVERFAVDLEHDGRWQENSTGTTVGHRRLVQLREPTLCGKIRVRILESRGSPSLSRISAY